MAGSMNRATIIGHLGADPEIRSAGSAKVANFRVATTEIWRDKQTGEKKDRTEWHSVVVWGDGICGVIEKYVRKGSKICVEGKLQTRKWQDKTGADRYSTEIVVNGMGGQVILLDRVNGLASDREPGADDDAARDRDYERSSRPTGGVGPGDYNGPTTPSGGGYGKTMDDEIPFAPEWR